jgi:hypothetical protein
MYADTSFRLKSRESVTELKNLEALKKFRVPGSGSG